MVNGGILRYIVNNNKAIVYFIKIKKKSMRTLKQICCMIHITSSAYQIKYTFLFNM